MTQTHTNGFARTTRAVGLAVAVLLVGIVPLRPAWAGDAQDARQLVEKARMTFENILADKEIGPNLRTLLHRAKGVLVYPEVLRGAFLFGGAGGTGVLVVRNDKTSGWAGPAFYTIGEASFGLQAGAEASEVVLVALTDRGVTALLSTSGKLGANAAVAAGPVGVGAEAATANLSADLVSYSRNQGLYAGVSLEGAVVSPRDGLNHAYYGKAVTPTEILIRREVSNRQAAPLIAEVAAVAGGTATAHRSAGKAK